MNLTFIFIIIECVWISISKIFVGQVCYIIQMNSLTNNFFLWMNLYSSWIIDKNYMIDNLHAFNIMASQLNFVEIEMNAKNKYINLLFSSSYS